jgi:hypothetical protein
MRKRLIPAAILGYLAFGPGTAQAVTVSEYEAVIEGSGDWYRHDSEGVGSLERRAKFTWRTTIPSVTFYGKELGDTSPARISSGAAEARDDMVLPTPIGTLAGYCKGGPAVVRAGQLGRSLLPGDDGEEGLDVRVLGGIEIDLRECGGDKVVSPTTLVLDNGRHELGLGAFDARIEMPHEAIGMGKVIDLVEGTESGQRCPNHTNATVTCRLTWKATVTLTRKRQQDLSAPPPPDEPDVIAPEPVPEEDAVPLPVEPEKPEPAVAGEDLLGPLKGRLTSTGAMVTIACPAGCSGTATATRGVKRLARTRFTAAAGRPKRVRLRFRRRPGAVKVVVAVGGGRETLTLRRR